MKTFTITRTRMIAETYRIDAENEGEACDLIEEESANCEKLAETTYYSHSAIDKEEGPEIDKPLPASVERYLSNLAADRQIGETEPEVQP